MELRCARQVGVTRLREEKILDRAKRTCKGSVQGGGEAHPTYEKTAGLTRVARAKVSVV